MALSCSPNPSGRAPVSLENSSSHVPFRLTRTWRFLNLDRSFAYSLCLPIRMPFVSRMKRYLPSMKSRTLMRCSHPMVGSFPLIRTCLRCFLRFLSISLQPPQDGNIRQNRWVLRPHSMPSRIRIVSNIPHSLPLIFHRRILKV